MQTKGFIFDLDGVIVDTAKYHFIAWKNLANSIGIDFTELQNEQLKGVSRVKSLEKILKWGGKEIPENEFTRLMQQKNDDYLSHISTMNAEEILPDVSKVLDFLTREKQGVALGSASKNARMILKKVHLINQFEAIVDGNDVTKGKPNPEVFLNAAKELNIPKENCIVFEDSVSGVQAANAANMVSIGIGDSTVLQEADYVFKDFTEIAIDFLKELIKEKRT